jgi:hypothetical protein
MKQHNDLMPDGNVCKALRKFRIDNECALNIRYRPMPWDLVGVGVRGTDRF